VAVGAWFGTGKQEKQKQKGLSFRVSESKILLTARGTIPGASALPCVSCQTMRYAAAAEGRVEGAQGAATPSFPRNGPCFVKKTANRAVCVAESFVGVSITIGTTSGLTVFASRRWG
jgi:hypothetical protein